MGNDEMRQNYKIVERLLVPVSDAHTLSTEGAEPDWKPPLAPYVPKLQREAASLIQELGEALESWAEYDKERSHPSPDLLLRANLLKKASGLSYAVLSKLKEA